MLFVMLFLFRVSRVGFVEVGLRVSIVLVFGFVFR